MSMMWVVGLGVTMLPTTPVVDVGVSATNERERYAGASVGVTGRLPSPPQPARPRQSAEYIIARRSGARTSFWGMMELL